MVFVASKMPNGIVIRGNSGSATLKAPRRVIPGAPANSDAPMIAGFAITQVPKKIWDEWLSANWNSDMVLNHLVFAHHDQNECTALCWKYARVRSGMEQINQVQS